MNKLFLGLLVIVTFTFVACNKDDDNTVKPFTIKSADVTTTFGQDNFGNASTGGTCTGANKSPQLTWENAPSGTKSFAITMIDLNAFGPNIPFDHWLVINIPTSSNSLVKDAGNASGANLPAGAIHTPNGAYPNFVTNPDFVKAYAGVCPNVGNTNQYEITVYALNVSTLNVTANATSTDVKAAIKAATISSTKMSVIASR
jgi:Raf kinase inhibitor-like YbhB/YbcL family protein